MKKLVFLPLFSSLLILFLLQAGITSCTKDKTIYDTVTVVKKDTIRIIDTVVIQDTAISLQLLTATSWRVQEMRGVIGNSILYYVRGGVNNTENYDHEYITFRPDKSGVLFDAAGAMHQITWNFTNSKNTEITMVVQNPFPMASQTVVYENIRYKDRALHFDQYWTYNNINSHAHLVRTPKAN